MAVLLIMTYPPNAATPPQRLSSLDALRGLDMLLIMGLDALVYRLSPLFADNAYVQEIRRQMGHVEWEGLVVYDMVFPLFVFIAGISMSFSLRKQISHAVPAWKSLLKMWKRALILVILGWIINGALTWDPQHMRYASVLGLIGISGAIAGSFTLLTRSGWKLSTLVAVILLLGVGLAQQFLGDYTPTGSINSYLDQLYCPGRLHYGTLDPEGILCTVSAVAICLLGYSGGMILRRNEYYNPKYTYMDDCGRAVALKVERTAVRIAKLFVTGAVLLAAGIFLPVPIIKNMWTPSFVLCCAGIGFWLVMLFHLIIDVWGVRLWSYPLRVIGMNALFAYMLVHLVNFTKLGEHIGCGFWQRVVEPQYLPAAYVGTGMLLAWLICLFLYRRFIFIKL